MKRLLALLLGLSLVLAFGACAREPVEYLPYVDPDDSPLTEVATPWGSLYYRSQWDEWMVTHQEQEVNRLVVEFSAKLEETEYPLFRVTVGRGQGGSHVGTLTDAEGTAREVYIRAETVPTDGTLTGEEQSRLYAMQEEINILIQNLK